MTQGPSNFADATRLPEPDLELIRAVLQITRVYYELWGKFPTALEVRAQLKGGGTQ